MYVTSGDYQGAELGPMRETEVLQSAQLTGVSAENVHFFRIPERQLMASVPDAVVRTSKLVAALKPDCIVGHDFEGGHNGHDAVSLCASLAAMASAIPLYVFPAYHGWPERRIWNQFIPGREITETLTLTPDQHELQDKVIAVHSTQTDFFNAIKSSSSYNLLSKREILRFVSEPIDYTQPPENPLGYEYPGSKLTFTSFISAIASALTGAGIEPDSQPK